MIMSYDFIFNAAETAGIIGIITVNISIYLKLSDRVDRISQRIDNLYEKLLGGLREK